MWILNRIVMGALFSTTLEVKVSHVPMLSQPKLVADFISEAAREVRPQ